MKFEQSHLAKKVPVKITQHGQERVDDYAWLRDENWKQIVAGDLNFKNPGIKEYIEYENNFTTAFMEDTKELQKSLYGEILSRIKEDDQSYPAKKSDYYYYKKEEKGKNYPIFCRKNGLDGKEEVYLDINVEAAPFKLYMMGQPLVSPDNKYLIHSFNTSGSLERTLKVRNLQTGKDFEWTVPETNGSYEWLQDSKHIHYVLRDPKTSRGYEVYLMNIEEGPASSRLIYKKPEQYEDMFMHLDQTTTGNFNLIGLHKSGSSVVFAVDAHDLEASPVLIKELQSGVEYQVEDYNGDFYMLTNQDGCNNFKILKTPVATVEAGNWQEFISEQNDIYKQSFCFYGQHMVIVVKNNEIGLNQLVVKDMNTLEEKVVKMSQEAYDLSFSGALEYDTNVVRFYFESPSQPVQTIDLNLNTLEQTVQKTKEVPGYDPSQYVVKRLYADGHDGAKVPLTVLHHKDTPIDGSAPAFVYAYGSYGYGMPDYFSSPVLSLVNRGFVFGIAHIRGGNEKGYTWYLDGKMKKKMNTFLDYISCCEYLCDKSYTSRGNVVANGGSAGGLLMGVVTNLKPELFKTIVADVAFVDMINTISDETLPLTPPEWEEWGNPIKNKDEFEYMMSYSPYDNVEAKAYPNMLYNSGISDEQVTYWEPTKMVAKLRELKTDNNILCLNMKMHAGHAGATKRYEWIEDVAFKYAFIIKTTLGV